MKKRGYRSPKPPAQWCRYKCGMFALDQPYAYQHDGDEWVLWTNNPAHLEAVARWCLDAARWLRLKQIERGTPRKTKRKVKRKVRRSTTRKAVAA